MSKKIPAQFKNRISPQTIELGKQIARLFEAGGGVDGRCKTCAFREGTIPNMCADTLLDAIKCVSEQTAFYCHDKKKMHQSCDGWVGAIGAIGNRLPVPMPFKFSYQEFPNAEGPDKYHE